jgi:hypothetical protein
MKNKIGLNFPRPGSGCINFTFAVLLCLALSYPSFAVNSKVTRHNSSAELLKGKTEDVVIDSRGTIQLGRAAQELIGSESRCTSGSPLNSDGDVWSINSIVVSGGTVYLGTSPNGGIYKYSLDKLTKIYPIETNPQKSSEGENEIEHHSEAVGSDKSQSPTGSNEHIFAMATDVSGRLLAGISGEKCRLCRFSTGHLPADANNMEIIFEPNEAKYIFAITTDDSGNIYLGTGPEGKIYRLNSLGKKPQLVYDSPDKNILSLAIGSDGLIYAGSDSRGLVYEIDPRTNKVKVLYDSDQPEITSLLFVNSDILRDVSENQSDNNLRDVTDKVSDLYAAATSAEIVQEQKQFAASVYNDSLAGRPEPEEEREPSSDSGENGRKLQIANTRGPTNGKPAQGPQPPNKRAKPSKASYLYKITEDGFVNDIFSQTAVFFCLAQQDEKLLVGTGNKAQLYSVDPALEREAVVYEDEQASQITAIAVAGDNVYLGMANPAKLIKLTGGFASEGTYISDLIDAGQPAKWGKLQLDAEIPQGCKVLVSSRSGNVKDVNDSTFSQWSEPVEVTGPVQLTCPLGRFCQYKLILKSEAGDKSPLIREIAVADTVPNLAPQVESVTIARVNAAGKQGFFKISYSTKDDNEDKLVYKIDFRKLGRANWIELKDQCEDDNFEWDGKSVEDGRYEIRVTASDARSNTTSTALTGSRISEPVVVDNTGPEVKEVTIRSHVENDRSYKIFEFEAVDKLSAIGELEYTIDSNENWLGTVPDDFVFDTTNENFTIRKDLGENLLQGDHVLAIKISDSVGNTTYRTVDFIKD